LVVVAALAATQTLTPLTLAVVEAVAYLAAAQLQYIWKREVTLQRSVRAALDGLNRAVACLALVLSLLLVAV
jgi:hypothetical protein